MKKMSNIMVILGVFILALAVSAWAQPAPPAGPGAGQGAMTPKAGKGMQYDAKSLETVSGEVTQVRTMGRKAKGMQLQMKTDKETLVVFLGPAPYLEQQKMTLAVGDKVEIKGSRIQHPQQAMLIAGEVKKGDQVVKFRDDQGKPLWAPQMPKRKMPTE
jgi:hypothetical protein